jgi:tetratricopeptide (TPR) repeat protein
LTAWLAESERQPRVERIDVARFGRAELVELLTAIAGAPQAPTLVESIARRSDGNAFFAEELVAAVDETGQVSARLPETLRGVLMVRLAARSETAGRLVEVAAVAGRQVEHDVLADVCGLSEDELRTALREAVEAQILVVERERATERYQFRHALAQEAAYDELLPAERRGLHAAYARAIEARPAGGGAAAASRLVELAHHWTAAHDPSRALAAAIEAGDASRAVFAFAEAARQYEHAIELWDVVPVADRPADRDLGDLYDAASAAATVVGDASRAVNLAHRAIELVDGAPGSADDPERRARARERLGLAAWLAGDTATSIRLLEEAVDRLEGSPPSIGQARVLSGLAANLMLAGRASESIPFAERAIESARTIGDRSIEARAMNTLGVDRAALGNIAGGIDLLRQSLAIAIPLGDPTEVPRAHANLGTVLETGGFVEEALDVLLAGLEAIRRYGSELSFGIFLAVNTAAMLIELGRYPEAAELLERQVAHALPGVTTIHLHATLAHLGLRTGDLSAARRHLEIAKSEATRIEDAQYVIDLHAFGTEIELWEGDPAAAMAIARKGFDRLVEIDDAVIIGQLAMAAAHAGADQALRARASRDLVGAADAVEAVRDVIERYRAATSRLAEPDALATHELEWRMAVCATELARANGDEDPVL